MYRNIRAFDRDKPNTPNSDIQYAITAGNERGKFALDNSHHPFLVLNKPVDYDGGDREFILTITASVSVYIFNKILCGEIEKYKNKKELLNEFIIVYGIYFNSSFFK